MAQRRANNAAKAAAKAQGAVEGSG